MRLLICLVLGHPDERGAAVHPGASPGGGWYKTYCCRRCGHRVVRWL